nr:retrotransposon protein, putative, unclassified, expressed [Tanacetum cinerariifolium]
MYMAKIQKVLQVTGDNFGPTYDTEPLEQGDQNNDDNDEDEHVELANLIANLKLDIDKNKKIQNQLRKANATLTHELDKSNLLLLSQMTFGIDAKVCFIKKRKSTCNIRDLQGNDLLTGTLGSALYKISLQESSSPTPIYFLAKASPTQEWLWHRRLSHLNFDTINMLSKNNIVKGLPKLKNGKNLDKMKEKGDSCIFVGYSTPSKGYRVYNKRTKLIVESIHLNFDEIKEMTNQSVSKYSALSNNSKQQDTQHTKNIQPTLELTTPTTNVNVEENNNDQAEDAQFVPYGFFNLFCTLPDGFVDPDHPEKVYRLRKALYGLKQAPRAWYGELSTFLMSKEAEYVVLSASCAQVMWMRTQLKDYGFDYNRIPLYCDSQSAITISYNLMQHSHTNHINVRYHFIKEQVERGIIELFFFRTEY